LISPSTPSYDQEWPSLTGRRGRSLP